MNRERAKELLPIIQAYAEGKEIECKLLRKPEGKWEGVTNFTICAGLEYRIKPEPREFWLNVYEHDAFAYKSKSRALNAKHHTCKETILVREVL